MEKNSCPVSDSRATDSSQKEQYDPLFRSLTDEEMREAVQNLVKYPKVIRSEVDPHIPGQTHAAISMRLLSEPRRTKNNKLIHGLIKVNCVSGGEQLVLR